MGYQVEVRQEAARDVLCIVARCTLSAMGETIGGCFGEMHALIVSQGLQVTGAPFVVYPDARYDEATQGTIECCFPVAPGAQPHGRVELRRLAACELAWAVHRGPYDHLPEAYAALRAWMEAHERRAAGPPRETYLTDARTPPPELLTEVAWPLG